MTEIALMKIPNGLVPADNNSDEFLKKIKLGEIIHSDFKRLEIISFTKNYLLS